MYHVSDPEDFHHATEAELHADLKEAQQVLAQAFAHTPATHEEGQEHQAHIEATQRRIELTEAELRTR